MHDNSSSFSNYAYTPLGAVKDPRTVILNQASSVCNGIVSLISTIVSVVLGIYGLYLFFAHPRLGNTANCHASTIRTLMGGYSGLLLAFAMFLLVSAFLSCCVCVPMCKLWITLIRRCIECSQCIVGCVLIPLFIAFGVYVLLYSSGCGEVHPEFMFDVRRYTIISVVVGAVELSITCITICCCTVAESLVSSSSSN